jgi:hypothetical protein
MFTVDRPSCSVVQISIQVARTRDENPPYDTPLLLHPLPETADMSLPVPDVGKRPRDDLTDALIQEALQEEQERKRQKKAQQGKGPSWVVPLLLHMKRTASCL